MRSLLHRLINNFRYRSDRRAREVALFASRQIAQFLQESRRQQKIELQDVAATLSISPAAMAKLEGGEGFHRLGIAVLVAWAHRLGHTLTLSAKIPGELSVASGQQFLKVQ